VGGIFVMDMESTVNSVLTNKEYCPCLFLGRSVMTFKKVYKDRIFSVSSLNDVRYVLEEFSGMSGLGDKYFVMDGIGYLNTVGQNSLLKFIEESKFPIILLSYFDIVSPIILSRMKFVFKEPIIQIKNLKFMSVDSALTLLEDKKSKDPDFTAMDEVKFMAEHCPKVFALMNMDADHNFNSKRIMRLLGKLV
jgi:hypothetical protein